MLKKMAVGQLQANCYILGCNNSKEGMVIDPGGDVLSIVKEISKAGLKIEKIVLTHGHFDHTDGAVELRDATKAPVFIHSADSTSLGFNPDGYLDEGQVFDIGDYKISVIHTPGHSPGGVCLFAPGAVFTGDTLFSGSIGRTDFPGGDYDSLIQGVIKKIFPLGDNLRVYPGHGPSSSIGQERKFNPFFQNVRA